MSAVHPTEYSHRPAALELSERERANADRYPQWFWDGFEGARGLWHVTTGCETTPEGEALEECCEFRRTREPDPDAIARHRVDPHARMRRRRRRQRERQRSRRRARAPISLW